VHLSFGQRLPQHLRTEIRRRRHQTPVGVIEPRRARRSLLIE